MRLVAVNTIGLTGAEMIAAELARSPDILMLPGQNFIGFGTRTYRAHDYAGWDPVAIFQNLDKNHVTRAGRVWAGLTKSMSPEMLERYDRASHEAEFVRLASTASSPIDHFQNFTIAFATASGLDVSDYREFGFFGNNIVLTAGGYADFLDRAVVIDFTCPVDYWLANIGQRAVWDCLGAIRFWLANMLLVRRWAARHPANYRRVDLRELVADPEAVRSGLASFLGCRLDGEAAVPDGFSEYSPAVVTSTELIASDVRDIYSGWAEFDMAIDFESWADSFLSQPEADRLLDRFQLFWDTTSHTNLDWAGPVADELVESAVAFTGAQTSKNTSRWFYHDAFALHSDDYQNPHGNLEHYLGMLEDEIVLPSMAAHVRIVLRYLERVADNITKRAYSALPIRETSLYRRLLEQRENFARWDVAQTFADVEAHIDEANAAMAKFF